MKKEGHYTLKEVKQLPEKGNQNFLYFLEGDSIERLYRYFKGSWKQINLGGASSDNNIKIKVIKTYVSTIGPSQTIIPLDLPQGSEVKNIDSKVFAYNRLVLTPSFNYSHTVNNGVGSFVINNTTIEGGDSYSSIYPINTSLLSGNLILNLKDSNGNTVQTSNSLGTNINNLQVFSNIDFSNPSNTYFVEISPSSTLTYDSIDYQLLSQNNTITLQNYNGNGSNIYLDNFTEILSSKTKEVIFPYSFQSLVTSNTDFDLTQRANSVFVGDYIDLINDTSGSGNEVSRIDLIVYYI